MPYQCSIEETSSHLSSAIFFLLFLSFDRLSMTSFSPYPSRLRTRGFSFPPHSLHSHVCLLCRRFSFLLSHLNDFSPISPLTYSCTVLYVVVRLWSHFYFYVTHVFQCEYMKIWSHIIICSTTIIHLLYVQRIMMVYRHSSSHFWFVV